VKRDGDRLTIEGRLVDVAKNRKIWVQEFVGTTGEVRALAQQVATAVGRAAGQSRAR
jgi:TolB-like protein